VRIFSNATSYVTHEKETRFNEMYAHEDESRNSQTCLIRLQHKLLRNSIQDKHTRVYTVLALLEWWLGVVVRSERE